MGERKELESRIQAAKGSRGRVKRGRVAGFVEFIELLGFFGLKGKT
jgi:hypothetical protein